jgi:hypothetical protein
VPKKIAPWLTYLLNGTFFMMKNAFKQITLDLAGQSCSVTLTRLSIILNDQPEQLHLCQLWS